MEITWRAEGRSLPVVVLAVVLVLMACEAPLRAEGRAPARRAAVCLLFAGDLLMAREGRDLPLLVERGWTWPFGGVAPLVAEADLFALNLEGPLVGGRTTPMRGKSYVYRMPLPVASALAGAKVGLAFLANNHVMDQGAEGLRSTLDALDRAGVSHVGAGVDRVAARRVRVLSVGGRRIAFLAATTTFPLAAHAGDATPGVAGVRRPEELGRFVRSARAGLKEPADRWVLSLHMGEELAPAPGPWHRAMARAAVEGGVDLVVGHHPHVTQGIERWGEGWIAYSLGNFAFASNSRRVSGALLEVALGAERGRDRLTWIPLETRNDRVSHRPRPATGEEASRACRRLVELSSELAGEVEYELMNDRVNLSAHAVRSTRPLRETGVLPAQGGGVVSDGGAVTDAGEGP